MFNFKIPSHKEAEKAYEQAHKLVDISDKCPNVVGKTIRTIIYLGTPDGIPINFHLEINDDGKIYISKVTRGDLEDDVSN